MATGTSTKSRESNSRIAGSTSATSQATPNSGGQ